MARLNQAEQWGPEEERRLRGAWVVEPPRLDGPVLLADYDPAWPAYFEREAARIRSLLGGQVGRNLRFRDHLRADAPDRELYERTKRELAARDWTYIPQYADAKSEVVEDILRRS